MNKMDCRCVEMTEFALNEGFTVADFNAANVGITPWLERQPGFIDRVIVVQTSGDITDMVFWRCEREARAAVRRLMRELADSPIHAVINQRTVSWRIAAVLEAGAGLA